MVHDALARWANDELRSTNAQIEFVLRRALAEAGRLPDRVGRLPRRGRPPKNRDPDGHPPTTRDRDGDPSAPRDQDGGPPPGRDRDGSSSTRSDQDGDE